MAFYYNQKYCIGCRTCQVACKDKNDLPIGVLFRRVRSFETGKYPKPGKFNFAQTCNHCTSPTCVVSCPTGSLYVAGDKTVQQKHVLCIACLRCVESCPYKHPQYLESEGIVLKCDACITLRAMGENPACAATCPMRTLEFGDAEELRAKHAGEDLTMEFPFLPDPSKTNPSTLVRGRDCAFDPEFREHKIV